MRQELQASEQRESTPITQVQASRLFHLCRPGVTPPANACTLGDVALGLNLTVDTAAKLLQVADSHFRFRSWRRVFIAGVALLVVAIAYNAIGQPSPTQPACPFRSSSPPIARVDTPRGFTVTITQPGGASTYVGKPKKVALIRKESQQFLRASIGKEILSMVENSMDLGINNGVTRVTVAVETEVGKTSFDVKASPGVSWSSLPGGENELKAEIDKGLAEGWSSLVPPQ
jgi:hypothetical protein